MTPQAVQKPSLRLRTSKPYLDSSNSLSSLRRPYDTTSSGASTTATTNVKTMAFTPLNPTSSSATPMLASPASIRSTHTDAGSIMDSSHTNTSGAIAIHRGAIDNTTITQRPPMEVMTKVRDVLDSIGICVQPESSFRFRCIRPSQSSNGNGTSQEMNEPSTPEPTMTTIYADDPSRDPAGEVRFSVELTRLSGLNDTYSLDIRRLKGNLRSYQFLYETIRDRARLSA